MRIIDTESDSKKLTCFTFLENNKIIKSFYQTEFESKFIVSEDSDEIAILSKGCINIIKINDNHEFYLSVKKNDKEF